MKVFIVILLLSLVRCGNALKIPRNIVLEFELKNVGTVSLNLKKTSLLYDNSTLSTEDLYHSKPNKKTRNYAAYNADFYVTYTMADKKTQRRYMGLFNFKKKSYVLNQAGAIVEGVNIYNVTIEGKDYTVTEDEDYFKFYSKKEVDVTRQKRQVRGSHTNVILEVLAVLDFSVYQSFYETAKNNRNKAISAIMAYYSHIFAAIDSKYRSIKTGKFRYSVKWSGIYITTTKTNSFTETIRSGKSVDFPNALLELEKWLKINKGKLKKYDIVASYTNLNSKNGETGYSYIGKTCNKEALSITQDAGIYGTSDIGAHEIGHNMGAKHDGDGNSCSSEDQFLMATMHQPFTKDNLHTFSPCSIKAFEKHMSKPEQSCLLTTNLNNEFAVEKHLKTNMGETYSLDQQCTQAVGSGSYFCKDHKQDEKICKELWCHYPDRGNCLIGGSNRAYDGTKCGDGMWCQQKKCVPATNKG